MAVDTVAGELKRRALEQRLLEEAERNYRAHVAERMSNGAEPHRGGDSQRPRGANEARQLEVP